MTLLRRALGTLAWVAALIALEAALGWGLTRATASRGLLTPGGAPDRALIALAGAYLVTRLGVLFVAVPWATYKLAAAAVRR